MFSCSRWFGKREGAPYRRLLPDHPISWVCYYGENSPDLSFDQYKLAVLEPDHHIPIKPLLSRGTKVLAYLSLGEIGNYRSYFKEAKEKGLLLKPVEHWEGSYAVKFSAPGWTEMLTEKLIPNLLREGYSGLFFDTVDSVVFEGYHPESKQKNIEKLKKLFKNIRRAYPDTILVVNRGFEVLPELGPYIDGVLAENVYTEYDFEKKVSYIKPAEEYQTVIDQLTGLRKKYHIHLFSLDYWNPEDKEGIEKIRKFYELRGISPSISTIELDRLL